MKDSDMNVSVVERPDAVSRNDHYGSNNPPLEPQRLIKLPLGAVRPRGWLKHQLNLMVDGMTGRLSELSEFLKADNGVATVSRCSDFHQCVRSRC